MGNRDRCAVLVSSCDKYQEVWEPFFYFFKKYWPACPYQIFLNTETKKCDIRDPHITTINYPLKEKTWSQRLKHALCSIQNEYVIFLLEDFFLRDEVRQDEIEKCVKILDGDHSISVIDFELAGNIHARTTRYSGYVQREMTEMYFLNCQSSIWRRKDLIRYLSPYESAWQFELYGSERARLYGKTFLLQNEQEKPVFSYNVNWDTGYGLHSGKWLKSNVELFSSNGIVVNFSNLGFYEKKNEEVHYSAPPKCFMDRWLGFWYGGITSPRVSIKDWAKLLLKDQKKFLSVTKIKLKYAFTDYRG